LKENSSQDFIVGDSYTIADFALLSVYGSVANHPLRKDEVLPILENYPTLKAYLEGKWEAQKAYFDSRDEHSY